MGQATKKQIAFATAISEELHIKFPEQVTFETMNDFISENLYSYQMQKNDAIRTQIIDGISIVDYAKEIGFTPIKKGKYYSLKEHDSVMIDPDKKCYWQNSVAGNRGAIGQGDSVIGFAMKFTGRSSAEVMKDFAARINTDVPIKKAFTTQKTFVTKEKPKFVLPEKADNMRRVYAYLIKSRMIDQDVVQDFVSRKLLYQDRYGNCVFVSYDKEQPVFACLRGTHTDVRFVGDVIGSNYEKGMLIDHNSKNLIVTESMIDAMSIMSILKAQGIDYHDYSYIALAGATKFLALFNYLDKNPTEHVMLALDNDKGGIQNMNLIQNEIQSKGLNLVVTEHLPGSEKDWNDELKQGIHHFSVSEIDFLQKRSQNKALKVKSFVLEDGVCMAAFSLNGEEFKEGVWKERDQYYVLTGMDFDNTSEKYYLTKNDVKTMKAKISFEKNELPDGLIYIASEKDKIVKKKQVIDTPMQRAMKRREELNRQRGCEKGREHEMEI